MRPAMLIAQPVMAPGLEQPLPDDPPICFDH